MCVQQKVNQFHTTQTEKRTVITLDQWVCILFFLYKKLPPQWYKIEKLWIHLYIFLTEFSQHFHHFTFYLLPAPPPLTPSPSDLCGAAPRWRSPRLQRKPRWALARAGRSEPSAGMRVWAGPLSRLAPGGCAGSWRPQWASASASPGAPPGLARARHVPALALTPWWWELRKRRETGKGGKKWKRECYLCVSS